MPTPSNTTEMQTFLVNLDLSRIALCNAGCNTRADILLTKRKETDTMPSFASYEDVAKSLEPDVLSLIQAHFKSELDAAIKAKDAEIDGLNKSITNLQTTVDTLKKSAPTEPSEPSPEELLKGLNPEVKKMFENQQALLNQLIAKDQEATANARFAAVKALPVEEAALKEVLKTASPATYDVLVAAAKAVSEATLTEPAGSDADGDISKSANDAYAVLEKSAKEYMTAHPEMSFEQAFTAVCTSNPDAYVNYTKGAK